MKLEDLTMKPIENLKGGNGTVYCSNNFPAGDTVMCCMRLGPGVSIGMHSHPQGEELYCVLEGGYATINGEKTKMAICRAGEEHDCINETDKDLLLLSVQPIM